MLAFDPASKNEYERFKMPSPLYISPSAVSQQDRTTKSDSSSKFDISSLVKRLSSIL